VPYLRLALHFERRKLTATDENALHHSWYDLVGGYRADVWEEVVARLMRTCKFMPVPAEALELMEPVALALAEAKQEAEYEAETQRRLAAGIPERNPRARDIAEAVATFKRIITDKPAPPARPQLTDYPPDDRLLPDGGAE